MAVIFDRDGVLTYFDVEGAQQFFQPLLPFSLFELAQRWQQWGGVHGFPATLEQEHAFFAGFWRNLQQECSLTDAQYRQLDACSYTDFMRVYPEVIDVLRALKARKIPVGVLSNFSLASLEGSLEAVGVREWIDVACAATTIGYAKPAVAAYHYAARSLHVPPEACLFFDDELACVEGARAAGMTAYHVDRQRAQDDLIDQSIHNLSAVLEIAFKYPPH